MCDLNWTSIAFRLLVKSRVQSFPSASQLIIIFLYCHLFSPADVTPSLVCVRSETECRGLMSDQWGPCTVTSAGESEESGQNRPRHHQSLSMSTVWAFNMDLVNMS